MIIHKIIIILRLSSYIGNWQHIRVCILIIIVCTSALVVGLCSITSVVLNRSSPSLHNKYDDYTKEELQKENVTTLSERIDGSNFGEVTLTEELRLYDSEHLLSVYIPECKNLVFHNESYLYMSKDLEETFDTRNLGLHSYIYMLEGSFVLYRICLKGIQEDAQIKLFVFDNLDSFDDYQADLTNGVDTSLLHKDFSVNATSLHCTEFEVSVKNEGFFFFVGEANNPVTYQYNVTGIVMKLSYTNYSEACTISSTEGCTLSLKELSGDICVLVHTRPLSKYVDDSTITHVVIDVKANDNKSQLILLLSAPLVGVAVVVSCLITMCVGFCYLRCKKKQHYVRMNNMTN